MDDILTRIVRTKSEEVLELRRRSSELEAEARSRPPPRDFHSALGGKREVAVMAEVKRRSPGAGDIHIDLDPPRLAGRYVAGGASAVSVLTDRVYFSGSLEDLRAVRESVGVPVLRKDFVIDPVQIYEARAAEADAVLLIVRILTDARLRELRELAESFGLGVLVEAHDGDEVRRALASGARILGINNRDLGTFQTDLRVTLDLLHEVPDDVVLVSESGIRSGEDVRLMGSRGVDAVLVGEALVRQSDPVEGTRALCGHAKSPRTVPEGDAVV